MRLPDHPGVEGLLTRTFRLSTIAMVVVDISAARRLKLGVRGSTEREKLLSKDGGETEYAPVWTGQSTTPLGLEPTRDEQAVH